MKAVVFHHPKKVTVDDVPDAQVKVPTDAVVRITATAICGSDLHIYNGLIPQPRPFVLGHEFVGVVEDVGSAVTHLKKGDRVVVPFPIACGRCWFCSHQQHNHCEESNAKNYGPEGGLLTQKGGGMFGYTDLYGGYDGGQAEAVRVPFADVGPRKVPIDLTDEQVLFVSDILSTGYTAVDWAQLKGGEVVAVFGCGPVGLMAQKCAWLKGASRVIALDVEPYRMRKSREVAKTETIDVNQKDWLEQLRSMTGGRGADVAIDAVGMEAHHGLFGKLKNIAHLEVGSLNALRFAIEGVRRGGVVSIVGVYGAPYDNFPIGQLFDKGIRLAMGQAPVHMLIDELIQHLVAGRLKADDVITHRVPLIEAPHAYEIFNGKKDDCVKVVLKP